MKKVIKLSMPHYKFHLLLLKYCRQAVKYTALCILCLIVLLWSALNFASQMLQTALSVPTFVTIGTAFVSPAGVFVAL